MTNEECAWDWLEKELQIRKCKRNSVSRMVKSSIERHQSAGHAEAYNIAIKLVRQARMKQIKWLKSFWKK